MVSTVVCWGSTRSGELGVGGVENEFITSPVVHKVLSGLPVVDIACGIQHTVVLLEDGSLMSAGCNDHGQLGRSGPCRRPEIITELSSHQITQISCGEKHSAALTDTGQVYTWGGNDFLQLGRSELQSTENPHSPKVVKQLLSQTVVNLVCGANHNLVVTNKGDIFVWGCNSYGQLGLGNKDHVAAPTVLHSLRNLPVSCVAAGHSHTAFLSLSGALYTCGKNEHGQLGTGNAQPCTPFPTLVKSLRHQQARYVSCGEEHTVVLTRDGGIFTFGLGRFGQLGHGKKFDEELPLKVVELMGTIITQVACGRHHTMTYCAKSRRLYMFGQAGSGQLGLKDTTNRTSPVFLKELIENSRSDLATWKLFSGGDSCFALLRRKQACSSLDMRVFDERRLLTHFTVHSVEEMSRVSSEQLPPDLADFIEIVCSNAACLNASLLVNGEDTKAVTKANSGLDVPAAEKCLAKLADSTNVDLINLMSSLLETVMLPSLDSYPDVETLRVFLLLPLLPFFHQSRCLVVGLGEAVQKLPGVPSTVLDYWWRSYSKKSFTRFITTYKDCVMDSVENLGKSNVFERQKRLKDMIISIRMLKHLHTANTLQQPHLVQYDCFYLPELRNHIDIRHDYVVWIARQNRQRTGIIVPTDTFSFYDYPFIFDGPTKSEILHVDANLQMQQAIEEVHRRNIMSMMMPITPDTPLLVFRVSRESIIKDTLRAMSMHQPGDLKKPLRVEFTNEEAIDEGGVKKEFFMLLVRELLDPKYNMFTNYEESRMVWFSELTYEDDMMFMLVGVLCALAIYNNVIIELPFPLALYKILQNQQIGLNDLKELIPSTGKSLQYLLDYNEPDFEDVFNLTFAVDRNHFGEIKSHNLVEDGSNKTVDLSNKEEYVSAYVEYQLRGGVAKPLAAFITGFHKVLSGGVLHLFEPAELQAMVVGNEQYDWEAWEQQAAYKPEFSKDHPVIKNFWSVFHELDTSQKKKFLFFLTGSDRVPITGMKSIQIRFQPVHGGEKFLPVAHTCFNLIDLPCYKTKEILKKKLLQAINETQGFGLV